MPDTSICRMCGYVLQFIRGDSLCSPCRSMLAAVEKVKGE